MSIISELKSFWYHSKSGLHHGKASKLSRRGDYASALDHYETALNYAKLTDNAGSTATEMECLALTLMRLKEYERALKYAEDSNRIYKKLQEKDHSGFFTECVVRVEKLIAEVMKAKMANV